MNLDVVVGDLLGELVDRKVVGGIQDGHLRKIIGIDLHELDQLLPRIVALVEVDESNAFDDL